MRTLGSGSLSSAVSRGPRLSLPSRHNVMQSRHWGCEAWQGGRSHLISEGCSTEVEINTQGEAWLKLLGRAARTTLPIP